MLKMREKDSIPISLLDWHGWCEAPPLQDSLEEFSVFIYLFCLPHAEVNNAVNREELQVQLSKLQNIEKVMAVKYITIIHRIYEALKS